VSRPAISLVVIAYNMARELPRTLTSLMPPYQREIETVDYEVIVVDNGSQPPVEQPSDPRVRLVRVTDPQPSPARAVNRGISESRADLVGVMIDGARLASPGLIATAQRGAKLDPRAVVATLGFHLGPDAQGRSVRAGYTREREDELLASVEWQADGYRLFEIAAFAESSRDGWFMPIAESNAIFMRRALWDALGGYDERFVSSGGGLVNLDLYERALALPDSQLVMMLGEGTFHQLHGGAATNAPVSRWDEFHAEYATIRGREFRIPHAEPMFIGRVAAAVFDKLAWSAGRARESAAEGPRQP
jgi:glycosyltransferase involved in cell wall biosynthesis